MKRKRDYESPLRAEQAALTRARIIEVAAERYLPGSTEMRFEEIAASVPVSVRTVYRHFPTQRDLMAEVGSYLERHSGWHADQVTSGNLGEMTAASFLYWGRRIESQKRAPSQDLPGQTELRGRRVTAIERSIGPLTAGMDPHLARGVMAVFSGLCRFQFLSAMHEHYGLDGEQAGRAIEWTINTLVRGLEQRESDHGTNNPAARTARTTRTNEPAKTRKPGPKRRSRGR